MAEKTTLVFNLGALGQELEERIQGAVGEEMPLAWGDRQVPARVVSVSAEGGQVKVAMEFELEPGDLGFGIQGPFSVG